MIKKVFLFVLAISILAAVPPAQAQQPKVSRIGVVTAGGAWYEVIDGLRVGLGQLGLEEGKQFILVIRDTKGDAKAAEEATRNFEQEKVNLIYTTRTSVTIAAKRATQTSLSFSVPAPTRWFSGSWIVSQNRGEDSQTSTSRDTDITAKRLEILKDIVAKLRRE